MIHIRQFQPTDADAVSHVVRTTMRISNSNDYPIERLQPLIDYFSPTKIRQLNQERSCLVAEEHGLIIGTAALEGHEVVTFFILPDHQQRGIGSQLMHALEAIARQQDLGELSVHASITGAGFYQRHGFHPDGSILAGSAGPQIAMRKSMNEHMNT